MRRESPVWRAELNGLRKKNRALRRLLGVKRASLAQQSKRLEDTLALLTREQRSLALMQQESENDALTGLPKRATYASRLELSLQTARANPDHRFAVLSIGLDRFRFVNDSIGHRAGNELLKGVALRLASGVRSTDTVGWVGRESMIARLGGDAFAVLLDNIKTVENASVISDRIQRSLAEPFIVDGREIFATASIGLALSTAAYQSAEEVLRDADLAMYRAKARGKGRFQVFDSEMRANALVRWELETDLRHALKRNELRVYYQAKVALVTGEIVGYEALLRWEHPRRGLISPLQFIPIAEETGLIVQIGNWVLREACRQIGVWNQRLRAASPLALSVNLSGYQFSDTALFEQIAGAIEETGFTPQLLWFEITETNLMGNTEFVIDVLQKLQLIGVGLMIDDFGTGYSSLNYLSRFPFDTLKIDQSFIRAMDINPDGVEIIKTMLALAANLGMEVIAEGIETPSQEGKLKCLGCTYGQGYFFSKPQTAEATEQALIGSRDSEWGRRSPGERQNQTAKSRNEHLVTAARMT